MEDAATAEISRAQIWQWIHHSDALLQDGRPITTELFRLLVPAQLARIENVVGKDQFNNGKYEDAAEMLDDLVTQDTFPEFLTLSAYQYLN